MKTSSQADSQVELGGNNVSLFLSHWLKQMERGRNSPKQVERGRNSPKQMERGRNSPKQVERGGNFVILYEQLLL